MSIDLTIKVKVSDKALNELNRLLRTILTLIAMGSVLVSDTPQTGSEHRSPPLIDTR